jgi:hypothetical protein
MPTLEVTVSPEGETTLQTFGFSGPSCRAASQALEAALGLRHHEQLTAEFYETTPAETAVQQTE